MGGAESFTRRLAPKKDVNIMKAALTRIRIHGPWHQRLALVAIAFALGSAPALAQESAGSTTQDNTLLNTRIGTEGRQYGQTFRQVTVQALESFDTFRVSNIHPNLDWNNEAERARMLERARSARLPVTVTAALTFGRGDRASLNLEFLNSGGGEVSLSRSLEFRYESLPGLMAQIEYDLERDLKRQFRQLGQVVQVYGSRVYFDLGRSAGVAPGDIYRVYTQGEELTSRAGGSYGYLNNNTGIVRVLNVTGVYAEAEILLGQRTIRPDHWVEAAPGSPDDYRGEVLATMNDEVAISLGRRTGIEPGAEFAVRKDLNTIDDNDAFQVEVSRIRITEVEDEFSRGVVMRSDHYEVARGLIAPGDEVTEVRRRGGVQLGFNQVHLGLSDTPSMAYTVALKFESPGNQNLFYRLGAGYWDLSYLSAGIMGAANRSESFFYGIDAVYTDALATNLLASVNIPTPFPDLIRLNTEVGYLISADDSLTGLNVSLGINFLTPGY